MLNVFSRFFERHSFWNPRPAFWVLAMSFFLLGPISDSILDGFQISLPQLPFNADSLLEILFSFTWFPGGLYVMGELSKTDETKGGRNVVRLGYVMLANIVILVVFGVGLNSANNMAVSIGWQLPLYPTLSRFEEIIVSSCFVFLGVCAILIRRKLPGSPFTGVEKEEAEPAKPRTLAWYLALLGIILMFSSFFIELFDFVALEALILLVSGAVLFSVALLLRWVRKVRKNRSPPSP